MIILTTVLAAIFLSASIYLFIQMNKAQRPFKSFDKFYEKTETKHELELVLVDKLGNKWFAFKNMMETPPKRYTDLQAATRWGELGMTPEIFVREMTKARALISKDPNTASIKIQDLIDRSTVAAEEETLKMIAAQMFLLEGENPMILTAEYLEKKISIWEKDEDAKGFFLHKAFTTLRNLSELSQRDLLSYLREEALKKAMKKTRRLSTTLSQSVKK